ncbi:MAG TPA: GTP-binding protein, partial [Ilumatobacter sp.]|nr:GTP-binding protein [Ilumatobacter sp.]
YHDGLTYKVQAWTRDGEVRSMRFHRDNGALDIDLEGMHAVELSHLDVEWPSARLREMTLADTPGLDSVSIDVSLCTFDALTPTDESPGQADAVVYLMRHLHGSDVRFLEAFHDDDLAHPSPVNAIGVLSRADEIGAGRLDAMDSAARIAMRYRADAKLRRLCQTVVPVAGLLAQAASTLREAEFRSFGRVAELSVEERDTLLLSVDHFVADHPILAVTPIEREALLDRFGLYGVRQAVELLVHGAVTTSTELASALAHLSGIGALRAALVTRFGERAAILKARSALNAIEAELGENDAIAAQIERVRSGAHELVELRLLSDVHTGLVQLEAAEIDEVDRLMGGGSPSERVGLDNHAGPADVEQAAFAALVRWQRRAENPMSSQGVKNAARTIVRTYEGLLAHAGAELGRQVYTSRPATSDADQSS